MLQTHFISNVPATLNDCTDQIYTVVADEEDTVVFGEADDVSADAGSESEYDSDICSNDGDAEDELLQEQTCYFMQNVVYSIL